MQHLQKLESVDTVPILVVHTKRSYIPVNLSGKSVAITQVIIVNQTKSFRFEYVKTLIKCVLLLAFFLKIKTPSDNESSKQDKTNEIIACTFLNHSFELKGLTKHLYQCYISPNVEDTVCCPTLQHTSEVSNNNTKHGIIKRGHEDSESDSGEDSRSTSPLGDTISQKAANAAQLPANVNMVGEWDRYITYGKCPDDSHCKNVYPTILAKNGFYFNVEKDLSECFSCGGRVNVWEEETVVKDVHLKIFSQCDFANGKDTFNVPIHNDEKGNDTIYTELASGACGVNENVNIEPKCETVSTEHKSSKITHRHEKQRTETPLEQLSYAEDTLFASARHPDLASRENRTSTFLNWAYSHTASINSLVDAGLYYTG
ncbi:hypothetical protein DPMN_051627 [Dreissena polymorpha]|uniref:Uncharacterized protein n=2 Tax=Dreissena polymorpha TaxID=45954 RepID=A0A9D4CI62_DREPO|nr:hypothetical protein DPMN_051627 [Dreissena polymorpha]